MELETEVGVKVGIKAAVAVTGVSAVGNKVGGIRVTVGGTSTVGLGVGPAQAVIRIVPRRINLDFQDIGTTASILQ